MEKPENKYMKVAIKEAKKALEIEEVPIGAVIVKDDKIIARAHNLREIKKDATAHAELLAIKKACKKLDAWRLNDCTMYVTCEPCPMCAGAILNSRIKKVVFGAPDLKSGAVVSKLKMLDSELCNHTVSYEESALSNECEAMIKEFFKELRNRK
jgi:tRNA(adenine34) deaminase